MSHAVSSSVSTAASASRKLSVRFPVYQIDFSAVACGKNVASSKRRIRWRFGFSNKEALDSGETGTACRGEEHDVTLIWSVASGKRLIFSDGQELHYSTNRSGVFEYSWTMRGNHVIKVIAHATPTMSGNPTFKQYDLFVDGLTFFHFPKVFELGLKGSIHAPYPGVINKNDRPAPSSSTRVTTATANNSASDSGKAYYDLSKGEYIRPPQTVEEEIKIAIQASLEESRKYLSKSILVSASEDKEVAASPPLPAVVETVPPPQPDTTTDDLLDLMGDLAVTAPNSTSLVPTTIQQPESYTYDGINLLDATATPQPPHTSIIANVQSNYDPFASGQSTNAAPPLSTAQNNIPLVQHDPFAIPNNNNVHISSVSSTADDPFAPQQPLFTQSMPPPVAPSILHYATTAGATPAQPITAQPPLNAGPHYASSPPSQPQPGAASPFPNAPPPTPLTPNIIQTEQPKQPQVDDALRKLVNFDDISSPANDTTSFSLSMNTNILQEQEKKKAAIMKSNPAGNNWNNVGPQPSLAQMQSIRSTNTAKKEVMNAAAMVSHAT